MAQPMTRALGPLRFALWLAAAGLGAAAVWVTGEHALVPVFGAAAALLAVSALVSRPELGTLAFAALLYANVPVNIGRAVGNAEVLGIAVTALLALSVVVEVYVRRGGWVVDYAFVFLLGFLAVALLSALLSRYPKTSLQWTLTLVTEGALIYLLIINAVRHLATLRRVLWVLLCVCALTGALSAYQELTRTYDQSFMGFAQRKTERGLGDEHADDGLLRTRESLHPVYRAQGPLGDPNRYGQILIVMVPFGLMLAMRSRTWRARTLAAGLTAATLLGIFLTYSRGTMLILLIIPILMRMLGCLRTRHLALGAVVAVGLVAIVAPGTLKRVSSIAGVQALVSSQGDAEADGAIRGRTTAMLAALNAFRDHPVLGVGPGSYTPHYSVEYMANPEIAFRVRTTQRRAHSLYLEMAAETGLIGLLVFLSIPAWIALRLVFLRRTWLRRNPEHALWAGAFLVALFAYFGTAVFLHLAFQRYYWLLLGLSAAAVHVLSPREADGEIQARSV